jgi:RNA polymerase sigma-70 factor (ECF subfamily)
MLGAPADAEEVAQEVFLRVHRALPGFRGEAALSTWLYAITSRLCLNRLKAPHRRRRAEAELDVVADPAPGPGADLETAERDAALQRAIAALDDEARIVVVLRDVEGLSYEEIAAALELPIGTVRSRLHRARTALKESLRRWLD